MVYPIAKRVVTPIYGLWLRRVEGLENFPKDVPFIIAANHTSYYDTVLPYIITLQRLDKQVHALVTSRYWKIPPAKIFLEWGKCIPVYVGKDADAQRNERSLKLAENLLKKGHLIHIFPEGARSHDGKLKKGHTGAARLATKAKVPVVPFGIINSNNVMPKGAIFPRFRRADVKIGKPIYLDFSKKSEKAYKKATSKIMKEIAKLIGQEYNY